MPRGDNLRVSQLRLPPLRSLNTTPDVCSNVAKKRQRHRPDASARAESTGSGSLEEALAGWEGGDRAVDGEVPATAREVSRRRL